MITNIFWRTLRNKDRDIPFIMWWGFVWLMAWVSLLCSMIRIITFCIFTPHWEFKVLSWSLDCQNWYRNRNRKAPIDIYDMPSKIDKFFLT